MQQARKGLENVYKIKSGNSEEKRSVGIPRRKSESNVKTDGEVLVTEALGE
jgi:hypothetical protein